MESPEKILPAKAMRHVRKAQEEIKLAMEELAKFADPEYVKANPDEFKKLAKALQPAASSSADFQKSVTTRVYRQLHGVDVAKDRAVRKLENKLHGARRIDAANINNIRSDIMHEIRDMIKEGKFGAASRIPGAGPVAAVPAAVAAGAAVVAAAVEDFKITTRGADAGAVK